MIRFNFRGRCKCVLASVRQCEELRRGLDFALIPHLSYWLGSSHHGQVILLLRVSVPSFFKSEDRVVKKALNEKM